MGKSQRTKGAAGEREAAMILSESLGLTCERNLSQTRDGGDDLTGAAPYRVEVKRRARIGLIYEWLDQLEEGREQGQLPIVMARSDRREWFVAMPYWVFAEMAKK